MKSIILILSISFSLLVSVAFPQAPVVSWQRAFGGSGGDDAKDFQKTSDGGLIICGYNGSKDGDLTGITPSYALNYWVFKLDANHNVQWAKTYGGSKSDVPYSVCQTADGGYIIAGSSASNDGDVTGHHGSSEELDIWVIKLDVNGNLTWQKSLGGSLSESASMVQQLADGNYIIAGYAESTDGDVTGNPWGSNASFWVVKLSSSGSLISQKVYGGSSADEATSIQQTKNGQFIIAGYSKSTNGDVTDHHGTTSTSDTWVIKTDAAGNLLWQTSLGGIEDDVACDVRQAKGGGFIVAGYSYSPQGGNHGEADYSLWKISDAGVLIWQKLYGGSKNDFAYDVELLKDGSFILSGSSFSIDGDITDHYGTNTYENDFWIVKTNSSGNITWKKSFGGNVKDQAVAAQVLTDGTIYVLGNSTSADGDAVGNHSTSYGDLLLLQLGAIPINTIGETILSKNAPCWGESLTVDFTATGTFQPGNVFTAQVSKTNKDLIEMITIGTLESTTAGAIPVTMPEDLKSGEHSLRVISSSPFVYGAVGGEVTDGINLKCKKPDKGLHTSSITSTSGIPGWDAPGGCTISYVVRWKPTITSAWNYTNSDDTELLLSGLLPGTEYMWGVQSLCVTAPQVASEYSPMKYFTTLPQKLNAGAFETALLELYPNPVSTLLKVKCETQGNSMLTITNAIGQVVFYGHFTAPQMQIDVSTFAAGIYILQLKSYEGMMVKKFQKH